MDLLFKREQTSARFLKVAFKLWGKVEVSEEEQALIKRYNFGEASLIDGLQDNHLRNSVFVGLLGGLVAYIILGFLPDTLTNLLTLAATVGAGYWFFHKTRETIYVKDLLHGRHFTCLSIVDLARKEAWLEQQVAILRQVMESAKHWDGAESINIPALPKDEAKELMLAAA